MDVIRGVANDDIYTNDDSPVFEIVVDDDSQLTSRTNTSNSTCVMNICGSHIYKNTTK